MEKVREKVEENLVENGYLEENGGRMNQGFFICSEREKA